jgi:hypothetical protein
MQATQTMHNKSTFTAALRRYSQEAYTLAGFEPGSSVLEADALTEKNIRCSTYFIRRLCFKE